MTCKGTYYQAKTCNDAIGCGAPDCPVSLSSSRTAMRGLMHDVQDFHEMVKAPVHDHPSQATEPRARLRGKLIEEEYNETMRALFYGDDGPLDDRLLRDEYDLVGLADGLADMIYVIVGTALEFGIPLDKVWAEVQRSNMDKVRDVKYRDDGKILKPADWVPPDIEGCLK